MTVFKSFCVTHRPRDGLSDKDLNIFAEYIKKKCLYYYLITEKEGDAKHLHSCFVRNTPTTRSNLCNEVARLFPELDIDEKKVLLRGIKVWNSKDFLAYMEKGDSTVVVMKNLPEANILENYFPVSHVPTTQKKLQNHIFMNTLETLWKEYIPSYWSVNTENVRHFLFDMQYNERRIGIMDDKKLIQVSKWLVRWLLKANHCPLELPPFDREEGEDIEPLVRH